MERLIKRNVTPPGSFRFIHEETGFPFVADNLPALIEKVTKYLRANKREIPEDLAARIEHWLCQRMPEGICEDPDGKRHFHGAVHKPTETIVNNTLKLSYASPQKVDPKTAERRAVVCSGCQNNVRHHGCGSCRGVNKTIENLLDGRHTRQDNRLNVCNVLGVFLKTAVWERNPKVSFGGKLAVGETCWMNE